LSDINLTSVHSTSAISTSPWPPEAFFFFCFFFFWVAADEEEEESFFFCGAGSTVGRQKCQSMTRIRGREESRGRVQCELDGGGGGGVRAGRFPAPQTPPGDV